MEKRLINALIERMLCRLGKILAPTASSKLADRFYPLMEKVKRDEFTSMRKMRIKKYRNRMLVFSLFVSVVCASVLSKYTKLLAADATSTDMIVVDATPTDATPTDATAEEDNNLVEDGEWCTASSKNIYDIIFDDLEGAYNDLKKSEYSSYKFTISFTVYPVSSSKYNLLIL